MSVRSVLRSPWLYLAWALFVGAAVVASSFVDPHVFAFTVMILGGLSCPVGVAGLAVVLFARSNSLASRVTIGVALAVTAAAIFGALAILGTYHWA